MFQIAQILKINKLASLNTKTLCVLTSTKFWTFLACILLAYSNLSIKDEPTTYEQLKSPVPKQYQYAVSSRQGLRNTDLDISDSVNTGQIWHNGIDFVCQDKTEVYASKSGYVAECYPGYYNGPKWNGHPVYGGLIVLTHKDGTISLYAHLSQTNVNEGSFVEQGQVIGLSGGVKDRRASGHSTGPHLHFALYLNMNKIFE